MTLKKHFQIQDIVVLAKRFPSKELYHYECYHLSHIESTIPVKIFVNGLDFTHKLTTKSRLTKYALRYIIQNIFRLSFVKIASHFRGLYSDELFRQKFGRKTKSKKTKQLGSFSQIQAHMEKDKSKSRTNVPAQKRFVRANSPDTRASVSTETRTPTVPFCYGTTELLMKEAKIKRSFGRGFLVYLQSLIYKLRANPQIPDVTLHFDHSAFTYLYEHDIGSEDELIELFDSLLSKSHFPTRLDLEHLFWTMHKQRKVTIPDKHLGKIIGAYPVLDLIIEALLDYFKTKEHAPTAVPPQTFGSEVETSEGNTKKRRRK